MILLVIDDLPNEISEHLRSFTQQRPDWTQERILRSALSLFLLQHGVNDRAVSQVYLQSMFPEACQNGGVS
ncbi:MAG: DUF2811 domain-containing protein [Cyanobacteria bacterium J06627_28]